MSDSLSRARSLENLRDNRTISQLSEKERSQLLAHPHSRSVVNQAEKLRAAATRRSIITGIILVLETIALGFLLITKSKGTTLNVSITILAFIGAVFIGVLYAMTVRSELKLRNTIQQNIEASHNEPEFGKGYYHDGSPRERN